MIEAGMRIPADCILYEGMDITVDEAPYHEDRESIAPKNVSEGNDTVNNHTKNPDPFLLTRSLVMTGQGKAVVCAVGKNRYINSIEKEDQILGEDENFTPL